MTGLQIEPIARVESPFMEKFGVPRQSGLVDVSSRIMLLPPYNDPLALAGIDQFSHLWISFLFHLSDDRWRPQVRPPRLGGNTRIGVFASRSPFRPNRLGLSVVRLQQVISNDAEQGLLVRGLDAVDGTPVVDIKPYLPYADCISNADGGYAGNAPAADMQVSYSPQARSQLQALMPQRQAELEQLLRFDVRPAYLQADDGDYGMLFAGCNVRWTVSGRHVQVVSISVAG